MSRVSRDQLSLCHSVSRYITHSELQEEPFNGATTGITLISSFYSFTVPAMSPLYFLKGKVCKFPNREQEFESGSFPHPSLIGSDTSVLDD